ncbi:MAG: hypothetical protein WAQ27_00095 [Candidatus Microsaccharimonas sp.]
MSTIETNTPKESFDPAADNPFVSEAGSAARRLDGIQEPQETFDEPEAATETSAPVQESTPDQPIIWTPEDTSQQTPAERRARRRRIVLGTTAAVSLGLGVAGVISTAGGNNTPERGEANTAIHSITVNPDATFRLDPEVDDATLGPNSVLQLGAEFTIDINNDLRVLEGTNNGTWYGISKEDLAEVVPKVADVNDKDGYIWVNEQGVESTSQNAEQVSE